MKTCGLWRSRRLPSGTKRGVGGPDAQAALTECSSSGGLRSHASVEDWSHGQGMGATLRLASFNPDSRTPRYRRGGGPAVRPETAAPAATARIGVAPPRSHGVSFGCTDICTGGRRMVCQKCAKPSRLCLLNRADSCRGDLLNTLLDAQKFQGVTRPARNRGKIPGDIPSG